MHGFIRRYQKVIWSVLAVIVIITFVFWGSQTGDDPAQRRRPSPGKIFGKAVSFNDFMRAYWGVYLGYFLQTGQSPDTNNRRVAAQLEQMAWMRMLQVRKVEELGLYVPMDRAIEFIQQSPAFRNKAGFDAERYKQFIHGRLPGLRLTENDLLNIAREQLAIDQLKDIIASTAKVTNLEVRNAFADAGQKVAVAVVAFNSTNYTAAVKLTDKDIEDYFNKSKETYRIPDRAKVRYLKLGVDNFLPKVTVTDAEVKDRYEKEKEAFTDPATKKTKPLDAVRDEIRKAIATPRAMNLVREQAEKINDEVLPDPRNPQEKRPDLATVAQKHGLALATTDFFSEKEELKYASTPNFQRAALSLNTDSPYEMVGAPDGAYLLQFVARKPSELPALAAVRGKVIADLTRERALELCRKDGREKHDKFKPDLTPIKPGQKPKTSLETLAA
ncbi:MAG: SurA N-terminal domain-containing protein, partial [Verrucomicrobia bacterium]|nr:SurA N-terminal domain-containing protein [Verrucomicrobiota bacterium]